MRLGSILAEALTATAKLFPPVARGYRWVHQAATILKNEPASDGQRVRRRLRGLLGAMARHRPRTGKLAAAMSHFLKVSKSYWPGLFWCYDVADLPRTNNDLEHLFGSNRYHERRATGRRNASPAMVRTGASDRRNYYTTVTGCGERPGTQQHQPLANTPRRTGAATARPRASQPLPPRSHWLPAAVGGTNPQANFAVIEKKGPVLCPAAAGGSPLSAASHPSTC